MHLTETAASFLFDEHLEDSPNSWKVSIGLILTEQNGMQLRKKSQQAALKALGYGKIESVGIFL